MRFTGSPSNQGVPPANYYAQAPHNQPPQHGNAFGSQYQPFPPGQGHPSQQETLPQGIDLAQWGVNPATAQVGMQIGRSAVAAGQEYMQKNVSRQVLFFLTIVSYGN